VPVVVQVTTKTAEDRAMAVVLVQDRGRGIAPDVLPHIFERFHAGADSSGLGLGLYLAQAMVTAHGGTLSVDSQAGQGTSFTLRLPMLPVQPSP
jgi:signal transduction histidine kinase